MVMAEFFFFQSNGSFLYFWPLSRLIIGVTAFYFQYRLEDEFVIEERLALNSHIFKLVCVENLSLQENRHLFIFCQDI